MKIEVKEKDEKKLEKFPCLMRYTDVDVVLLITDKKDTGYVGVVVSRADTSYKIGNYAKEWTSENLVPFNGSITLSND